MQIELLIETFVSIMKPRFCGKIQLCSKTRESDLAVWWWLQTPEERF